MSNYYYYYYDYDYYYYYNILLYNYIITLNNNIGKIGS